MLKAGSPQKSYRVVDLRMQEVTHSNFPYLFSAFMISSRFILALFTSTLEHIGTQLLKSQFPFQFQAFSTYKNTHAILKWKSNVNNIDSEA